LICWQWRPMPDAIWNIESPIGKAVLISLFWLGWGSLLFSSFIINHFDLFGLRQVWLYLRSMEYRHVEFQKKSLYQYIRHPIMLGFIIAFWATPSMSVGHLLFASAMTAYILIGIRFEEHDLIQHIGKDYADYQQRVPMLFPFTKKGNLQSDQVQDTRTASQHPKSAKR